jgi:hypothetical protein
MMKKLLSCFLFTVFILSLRGQSVFVETGKLASSFLYKDSKGNKLNGLKGAMQNNLALGFRMAIHQSALHCSVGAAYNKYGARGSNPVLGNYYEWDATYLGANVGLDYEFFKPDIKYNEQHGFSFYLKTAFATEFLLDGTQNLNNQIYDLKGKEEFNKPLYFLRGGIGINYYLSKTFVLFTEYMGGKSFLFGDYKNQEQLRFITHNISVGVSVKLIE